jgi:hypothetical protein
LKAGSRRDIGAGAALRDSSSMTIGDLWPEIDSLHEADCEGTFTTTTHSHLEASTSHPQLDARGSRRERWEGTRDVAKSALLDQALGPSFAAQKSYGRGSTKKKAARILSDIPRDILPHMKRSFAEKRYSPSTGMDQSEWEIILEQLIIMGYVVK